MGEGVSKIRKNCQHCLWMVPKKDKQNLPNKSSGHYFLNYSSLETKLPVIFIKKNMYITLVFLLRLSQPFLQLMQIDVFLCTMVTNTWMKSLFMQNCWVFLTVFFSRSISLYFNYYWQYVSIFQKASIGKACRDINNTDLHQKYFHLILHLFEIKRFYILPLNI